ncbi:MAG: tetratricopeptide repeat protein [Deltaproteobacteria bacterium]|jgi:tetratricopeptide (TPR) repeat protein|nr:tetratricopeptide repeat protein [Deltaproteobacteria bacterium]MBW2534720.1 tetratricopeptide repeat protein [Deltaproteobacteria bacterium]
MARDADHWDAVEEATELLVQGDLQRGLEMLRDIIEADPQNPYAYHFLGTALFELGQLEPARDAYQAALLLSPNYLAARVALSHVLRLLKKPEAALAQANEALKRFPGDGAAMHAAGLAKADGGDRSGARRDLERYLQTGPELEAQLEVQGILQMLGIDDDEPPEA